MQIVRHVHWGFSTLLGDSSLFYYYVSCDRHDSYKHQGQALALDLANGSFSLGTDPFLVRFRSLSSQLCSSQVRVQFGWSSDLGHFRVNHVRVGFNLGGVWVQVTKGYRGRVSTGSARVEFGSDLFRVVYNSPVRIGYGSSVIWAGWDLVQCSGQYRVKCKSNWI